MSRFQPWLVVFLGTLGLSGCAGPFALPEEAQPEAAHGDDVYSYEVGIDNDLRSALEIDLQQHHELPVPVELGLSRSAREVRVEVLLAELLRPDQALELFFINSPRVHAELAKLGIAQAQQLQAGLVSNPGFALGALRPEGGGRWQLDAGISQSILDIFTRPLRTRLAKTEFATAQLVLYKNLNRQIYTVQDFYYRAVAARQLSALQSAHLDAAAANYGLATSLYEAGNIPEKNLLQYQLEVHAQEREWEQAKAEALQSQIELGSLLGLNSSSSMQLPDTLPALPPQESFSSAQLYETALVRRSDLTLAREQVAIAEYQLTLLQKTGAFTELRLGANLERETDGSYKAGPEIAISLPLFDRGHARQQTAGAAISHAQALLNERKIQAETEIASALVELTSKRGMAEQIQQTALPLQRRIQAFGLREYNFMLGSAFDLIQLKQQEFTLQREYVNALLAYWRARSRLALASGQALTVEQQEASTPDHQHIDHSLHHHGVNHD